MLDSDKYKKLINEYIDIDNQKKLVFQIKKYEQAASLRDSQKKICDDIKKMVMSNKEDRYIYLEIENYISNKYMIPNYDIFEKFIVIWFGIRKIEASDLLPWQEYITSFKRDYKLKKILGQDINL